MSLALIGTMSNFVGMNSKNWEHVPYLTFFP